MDATEAVGRLTVGQRLSCELYERYTMKLLGKQVKVKVLRVDLNAVKTKVVNVKVRTLETTDTGIPVGYDTFVKPQYLEELRAPQEGGDDRGREAQVVLPKDTPSVDVLAMGDDIVDDIPVVIANRHAGALRRPNHSSIALAVGIMGIGLPSSKTRPK